MQIYATPEDLTEGDWLTAPLPENVAQLLRRASVLVSREVAGNPTGAADALRDATCAQVAFWDELKVSPSQLTAVQVQRSRLLGDEVYYDTQGQAKARETALTGLCDEAMAILDAAGLIGAFEIADGRRLRSGDDRDPDQVPNAVTDFAAWFVHEVQVRRYVGSSGYGNDYADPAPVIGYYSDRTVVSGGEIVAQGRFAFGIDEAFIPLESLVTLPAQFGEREVRVVMTEVGDAGGLPLPAHQVIGVL